MRSLALALPLLCCAPPAASSVVRDRQPEAVGIAWATEGRSDEPPRVLWVEPESLTCTAPSGYPGFRTILGSCQEGETIDWLEVYVAFRPDEPYSRMALAHELEHAALMRRGLLDPFHWGSEWAAGGVVDQAKAAMEAAGL